MRTRSTKTLIAVALAAVLALGGAAAIAGHGPGPDRGHGGHGPEAGFGPGAMIGHLFHMAQELELTEEQRSAMHELVKANMDGALGASFKAMREAHEGVATVLHNPDSSEQQIRDACGEMAAQFEVHALATHGMIREISDILTAEQRERLDELALERKERPERRGGPHGAHGFMPHHPKSDG